MKLTHPDRVFWPQAGFTKQALADYYALAWPFMAPHVVGRPLALLRCPAGHRRRAASSRSISWRAPAAHIA